MSTPTPKPPLIDKLEPAYTYLEVAEALDVPLSYVRAEAASGRLRHFREGRFCKVLAADVTAWRLDQRERAELKRVGRTGRRELSSKPVRTKTARPVKRDYSHIDPDIRERLGLD